MNSILLVTFFCCSLFVSIVANAKIMAQMIEQSSVDQKIESKLYIDDSGTVRMIDNQNVETILAKLSSKVVENLTHDISIHIKNGLKNDYVYNGMTPFCNYPEEIYQISQDGETFVDLFRNPSSSCVGPYSTSTLNMGDDYYEEVKLLNGLYKGLRFSLSR